MNEFISAGGPFMWPLLACSVLMITISIERSWFLQNRLVSPKGLSNQIMNLVKNKPRKKTSFDNNKRNHIYFYGN